MGALTEDRTQYTEELVMTAGNNPTRDSYLSGVLMAIRAIVELVFLQESE